jgi:NADPH-dependent 2,4-dienoyl-CoA reductase/sulfur reductase-like enzyme
LPEKPQLDALEFVRKSTSLPIIAAGRMGRQEKIEQLLKENITDFIAIGRPLLADTSLLEKWQKQAFDSVNLCGYCLQGCLHRVKNGQSIGCNINPALGLPELKKTGKPIKITVVGGGPAGLSAAVNLIKKGHRVSLVEQQKKLGGQFALAWKAPGKHPMKDGLDYLVSFVKENADTLVLGKEFNTDVLNRLNPDLLVCATGSQQNIPDIEGLHDQYVLTAVEFLETKVMLPGKRVLVIGAGRTGLEIVEMLGAKGLDVVATKRTDTLGNDMEMITKKLILKRLEEMPNVNLLPGTAIIKFEADKVVAAQSGEHIQMEPFDAVILASGMVPVDSPGRVIEKSIENIEVIGDAAGIGDIYSAIHQGYDLACKY